MEHNMIIWCQKQFMIGLIEAELNCNLEQWQEAAEVQDILSEQDERTENEQGDVAAEDAALDESEADDLDEDEFEDEEINASDDEEFGMNM